MSPYLVYHITAADEQTAEILMALLAEKGFDTFEHNENQLSAYITEALYTGAAIDHFLNGLQDQFVFTFKQEQVEQKNWNAEWEKNFTPIKIGQKCLIRAPFHPADPEVQYDILIEPRMSFGTGHHETTWLMANEMLSIDFHNKKVCDAGTGTGILAILAAKCGAQDVFAVDNEEWAYHNANDNIAMNGIFDGIETALGGLELMEGRQFDIILANINKHIILQHIPLFFRCLQPGGLLLISGMFTRDLPDVEQEAGRYFFQVMSSSEKNEWVCAIFQNV